MSNMYIPDGWVIVRNKENKDYRVFGSWSGGYLDGDSWRINSGIADYVIDEGNIDFVGDSGSVYRCREGGGHITAYNYELLQGILERSEGYEVITFEQFEEEFECGK